MRTIVVVVLVLLVWLVAALALVGSGTAERLRPPMPQVVLFALTGLLLAAGTWITPLRQWALTLDLRIPVALHLSRFVGVYFLVLYGRGELPYAFAVPGGIGDVLVASLAGILLLTTSPNSPVGRRLYLAWNVLGLVDVLFVVSTAASVGMADPTSMGALLRLPLGLLPTFLVPLIIATHVLIFVLSGRLVASGL